MATKIGTVIDGKYEILKQIGKGGMSVVYLAMDKRLNKQWAVKEIKRVGFGKNNEQITNEVPADAEMMKRLDHPAIPTIVDIIDHKDNEFIYVVMDYVEGESLDKVLAEYGAQPQELVIDWAKQICDALGYLHKQKPPIIYRDMKPANVMLKPEGNIKIIDFGIAREYKEQNLADTTVLGTKGYASPEHYGGRQTDARSDIYTLGMTMHHLLTGVDPRPADYQYAPIRQWNPELSDGLERIIDKCVSPDPKDRYQNCDELLYALDHYKDDEAEYKKKQKMKLLSFIVFICLSVVMILLGGLMQFLFINENNNNYEILTDEKTASAETCEKAIGIYPDRFEAYSLLLDIYTRDVDFTQEESEKYSSLLEDATFDKNSPEALNLYYETGLAYLYTYSGGDNSFKSQITSSQSYFKHIADSENKSFEYYNISSSYNTLADCYTTFVLGNSDDEPTKEQYESFLTSIEECVSNLDGYDKAERAKLIMFETLTNNIIYLTKGFATTGVSEQAVVDDLTLLRDKANELVVNQEVNRKRQENIVGSYDYNLETIKRTYANTAERNQ